jgi:hypothetical protein
MNSSRMQLEKKELSGEELGDAKNFGLCRNLV